MSSPRDDEGAEERSAAHGRHEQPTSSVRPLFGTACHPGLLSTLLVLLGVLTSQIVSAPLHLRAALRPRSMCARDLGRPGSG